MKSALSEILRMITRTQRPRTLFGWKRDVAQLSFLSERWHGKRCLCGQEVEAERARLQRPPRCQHLPDRQPCRTLSACRSRSQQESPRLFE